MSTVDSVSRPLISEQTVNQKSHVPSQTQAKESNTLEQQPEKNIELNVNKEKLDKVINDFNRILEHSHTELKYIYHEKLQQYYVTLVNEQTKETIREIPPKKLLDIYASMKEYLGLFVDNKI